MHMQKSYVTAKPNYYIEIYFHIFIKTITFAGFFVKDVPVF